MDGTRRRSSHSSAGTSAMAMTRAAVTGRKNSAPARSANGKASSTPAPMIRVMEASRRSAPDIVADVDVLRSASEARGRMERGRFAGGGRVVPVSLVGRFLHGGTMPDARAR